MNFQTARATVAKLFGQGFKLHRGKNRCFLLKNGLAVADGRSWLECLRSYGEIMMLQNAIREKEAAEINARIEAFKKLHPEIDTEKPMTAEQLNCFDAFMDAKPVTMPPPKPSPPRIITDPIARTITVDSRKS